MNKIFMFPQGLTVFEWNPNLYGSEITIMSDLTCVHWKMENWQILNLLANTRPIMQDFPYTDMTSCIHETILY
jgi:hypothetical protein